MNITLLTYGSRGDVEPFIALADGLTASGWQVHLAAPEAFRFLLENPAVTFTGLPGQPSELVQRLEEIPGRNLARTVRSAAGFVFPIAAETMKRCQDACVDADVIVHTFLLTLAGYEIARERSIPNLSALFFPVFAPTKAFSAPNMPLIPLAPLRYASHQLTSQLFWQGSRLLYRRLKREHPLLPDLSGWPFSSREAPPILFAFSPSVVPRPSDWGGNIHITGYWTAPDPGVWVPQKRLAEFLKAGPAPVCLGTGSTTGKTAGRLTETFIQAVRQTGQRAVIVGTDPGFHLLDSILLLHSAPYSWLFPRCAAVVHHGGAGTTAAGLRAGIPNIVVPVTSDQPFWGERVRSLGAGPAPIPASRISPAALAGAINEAIHNPAIQLCARETGARLQNENGVQRAVEQIERTAASWPASER